MKRIYVPTSSALSWKPLLAKPDLHWKPGYSAMTLAQCWEDCDDAIPPEIARLLESSKHPAFDNPKLLLAIPEYCVPLPGGSRATQTDLFVLVRGTGGLGVIAIEGKVDEELGPTVAAKAREGDGDKKKGITSRLEYLHELLRLNQATTGHLRYQLLHRSAAAILIAQDFGAAATAMIVHSFSPTKMWFEDYEKFVTALNTQPSPDVLTGVGERGGVPLYLGWAVGDQRFRTNLAAISESRDP